MNNLYGAIAPTKKPYEVSSSRDSGLWSRVGSGLLFIGSLILFIGCVIFVSFLQGGLDFIFSIFMSDWNGANPQHMSEHTGSALIIAINLISGLVIALAAQKFARRWGRFFIFMSLVQPVPFIPYAITGHIGTVEVLVLFSGMLPAVWVIYKHFANYDPSSKPY